MSLKVEPYLSKSRQLEYAETTSFYVTLLGTTLLRRLSMFTATLKRIGP
jgi:hypothetical protein